MKLNNKFVTFSAVIIASTILLSGCIDPAKKSDQKINLTDSKITTQDTTQTNNTNTERPNTMSEITYKTLEDFKKIEAKQAVFETTKGTIVLDLYRDQAPLTTANFLDLIDSGFYDGIVFHRVIPDFMAQVGDPFTKDPTKTEAQWGMGGPTYRIMDEFHPDLKHDAPGILSMANAGPNTGGSQIFITYEPTPHLDGKHAVFGKLVEGMDVLESITKGDKIIKASYR